MAIFGSLSTVRAQAAAHPGLRTALDYVEQLLRLDSPERARLAKLAPGQSHREDLGGGLEANDAAYVTKARPDCFFESHRRFIDVQAVIEGAEIMEAADTSRLTVTEPYSAERDLIKYADTSDASALRMCAGLVAVFFPADGHLPCLQAGSPALVRKTVVKVPVG
ncbi:MAG: YhcH/YjgK/YiaL family protein [Opitutaceae bacterium]|nr:YhcH/YjgK/YiaL family protein [Opitutaceae bacterium]